MGLNTLQAQTKQEKQMIVRKTNVRALTKLKVKLSEKFKKEKAYALKLAKENNWPVTIKENGKFMELQKISDEGIPIYYTTYNVNAARSTRANTLHNGGLLNLNIEGQNMTAHIWDAALARRTHREYDGAGGTDRYSAGDDTTDLDEHSAHVTGTIIASGVDANAKGMAPQARAVGYDWDNDEAEATDAAANNGMLISNHSYGYIASRIPDDWFGQYGEDAHNWDAIMYNAPYYLMVVAAGNDGNDNNSNGSPLDNNSNYDKLSGHATAKNNLVVANANDATIDANGNLTNVTINSSSSEGPTDDYRIKPDITGNGTEVYSTVENADDAYGTMTGTSMASPNVAGTLLLLQQYYHDLNNNNYMRAATLKGLALHTADDAGIDGPDPIYGWGLLNAKRAAETIANNGTSTIIDERTLANGASYTINVIANGDEDLMASISWTDPAGAENDNTNDHTPALVNDLDIRITRGDDTYNPYKLTSVSENGTGDNTVDPFERIDVANTNAGDVYTITVTHKGNLASDQHYTLIVTGIVVPSDNPSVVTGDVSNITSTSATVAGNVVDQGASNVTERGVVWGTSPDPTVNDHKVSDANTGTGEYSVNITGLNSSTTYYVRAYAINGNGTSYGKTKVFTTLCGIVTDFPFTEDFEGGALPDCWTNEYVTDTQDWTYDDGGHNDHPAHAHGGSYNALFYNGSTTANVTKLVTPPMDLSNASSATLKFWHVQAEWDPDQDELRVYYKTSADGNWTLLKEYTSSVTDWTERTINLPNLSSQYYIAFQATGKYGYGVGIDDVEVSVTVNDNTPTVSTGDVTSITTNSATAAGEVTDEGSSSVTERGICWSTSENPTISDSHSSSGTGTGTFSVNLTNLNANTTYHVRAYATNSSGTSYGDDVSFTTDEEPTAPTVSTGDVTSITANSATAAGNVTNEGTASVTERGICWSTSENPTTSDSHSSSGTGTGSYTVNLTNLSANTTYHVRAYATNSVGTSYGDDVSFTTDDDSKVPTVTTGDITSITGNSATVAGNVTDEGSASVTERGICWSTSQNPTVSDSHASNGTGSGSFSVNLSDLNSSTTYYVRAYATNSVGTSYGENKSFTTLCGLVTEFPFTEDFEGGALPDCWTNEHVTDTQDWAYDDGGHNDHPAHAHGGSYNALFYNGSTTANVTKLVTPAMDLSNVSSATLKFWHVQAKWDPDQDELRVYYKTSADANWTLLKEYTSDVTDWTERTINLPNLSSQYYIAFQATGKYGYGVGIDDVEVSVVANNGSPTVSTGDVTSITASSATVAGNVTNEGDASVTERGICWATSQNPTTADSHTSNGSGTGSFSVNLSNLNANTTYYARAYATNSEGTSYGANVSFTTLCGLVTEFPFTEGFEDGELPSCWTNEYVTDTQDWAYDNGGHNDNPASAHTGDYNALFYNPSTTANVTKLVSPAMDLSDASSATLKFWHVQKYWSPDQDELRVYYKTAADGNWTLLEEYTSDVSDWTERTINLPNLSGEYYIAFQATGKYGYGVGVDDVEVSISQNQEASAYATQNFELEKVDLVARDGIFTLVSKNATIKQVEVYSLEGKKLYSSRSKEPVDRFSVNLRSVAKQVILFRVLLDNNKIAIIKGIR